jgi:hypothetical protein
MTCSSTHKARKVLACRLGCVVSLFVIAKKFPKEQNSKIKNEVIFDVFNCQK